MRSMLQKDNIMLYKTNGDVVKGLKACIVSETIIVSVENNDGLTIRKNDIIEHEQSNGVTEKYKVIKADYYDPDSVGMKDMGGKQYHCVVKKLSELEELQHGNNNFSFNASQIFFTSGNATLKNTQNNGFELSQIKTLIEAIKLSVQNTPTEDIITKSANTLVNELETPQLDESIINKMLERIKTALPTSADVMTLITSVNTFLSALKG
jgi:hypothetical protein